MARTLYLLHACANPVAGEAFATCNVLGKKGLLSQTLLRSLGPRNTAWGLRHGCNIQDWWGLHPDVSHPDCGVVRFHEITSEAGTLSRWHILRIRLPGPNHVTTVGFERLPDATTHYGLIAMTTGL
jgi:hypothetical protein